MAKILLVEDDNNLREIYEARLQAEGYAIISAKDGEEALVLAKQEHPDLVISDVMMPAVSGFEMLDILRNTEDLKDTKVIMLTALGQAEDKARADSLGANRYLVKSQVTLEDIVKTAQELLAPGGAPQPVPAAAAPPVQTAPVAVAVAPPPAAQPTPSAMPAPTPMPLTPVPTIAAAPSPPEPQTPTPPLPPTPPPAEPPQPPAASDDADQPALPAPPQTPPSATTVPKSLTQTASTEEATMKAQIEDFVKKADHGGELSAAPSPTPAPSPPPPAPQIPPASPAAAASPPNTQSTDQLVADAVNNLVSSTTEPPQTATTPPSNTPDSAETPAPPMDQKPAENDAVNVAHKKIISPISDPNAATRPDLNELLAREGITDINNLPHHPATPLNTPQAPSYQTPHPPGHVISPKGGNGIDPNSIAL